jgi:hypothetical protein
LDLIAPVRLRSLVFCEMLNKGYHNTLRKLAEKCNNAYKSSRREILDQNSVFIQCPTEGMCGWSEGKYTVLVCVFWTLTRKVQT